MDYTHTVHDAIREFVGEYQKNPFLFLYEGDIQALLFSIIWQKFGTERVKLKGGYHPQAYYGGSDSIETIPVKCEYPTPQGHTSGAGSFDIAVIDPDNLIQYDAIEAKAKGWGNDPFWNQNLRAAIEIKYCRIDWRRPQDILRMKAHFDRDVQKLKNYLEHYRGRPFLGVAILFLQSPALLPEPFLAEGAASGDYGDPSQGVFRCVVSPRALYWSAA